MKYEKPEVALLANASVAIQGGIKNTSTQYDTKPAQTVGAYEADE